MFSAPMEEFPWDNLRKTLHGGQRMAKAQNGKKTLPKVSTPEYGTQTLFDLCKILHGGHRMAKIQNGKEILRKVSTPSTVHECYR